MAATLQKQPEAAPCPSGCPGPASAIRAGPVRGRAAAGLVHCCKHTLCPGPCVCFLCFYLPEQKSRGCEQGLFQHSPCITC